MASKTAWISEATWVVSKTLYLLYLSDTTPPISENKNAGKRLAKSVSPSIKVEWVKVYITQLTAVFCIQVPISETDWPVKNKR
jgi:hypothetical protein